MKAILVNEDKSLRWDDVPDPVIKPDEVLVKIEAAALNRADLMQREGDYPSPAGCPEWMGLEVAGEIVEMGDEVSALSSWKLGDKVCALLGGGGYAEYVSVKYDMLMPVPKNCSMVEAARDLRYKGKNVGKAVLTEKNNPFYVRTCALFYVRVRFLYFFIERIP